MGSDLIVYTFSRSKVERGDFSHFLGRYAPDKLPTGRRLRDQMNAMMFCIEGYDHDEREIHSIPEVRRFYCAFHDAWPYWLYFCNLDQDALKMMVCCRLENFSALKVDGDEAVKVEADPLQLLRCIEADLPPMNAMCDRAAMFEDRIQSRTRAVFDYFGIPFETNQAET
jgi:hypothetical protein